MNTSKILVYYCYGFFFFLIIKKAIILTLGQEKTNQHKMLLQETFTYPGKVISKNTYPRKEESQDVWTQNTDLKLFYVSENPKQRKSGKV